LSDGHPQLQKPAPDCRNPNPTESELRAQYVGSLRARSTSRKPTVATAKRRDGRAAARENCVALGLPCEWSEVRARLLVLSVRACCSPATKARPAGRRYSCQGRLKCGPLTPVEKWTTWSSAAASRGASRRRAERDAAGAVGLGGPAVGFELALQKEALEGALRSSASAAKVIGQAISAGFAAGRESRSLPRSR